MYSFSLNTKILVYQFDECEQEIKLLINKAKLTTKNAYAPYSNYQVGAAVLLENNVIITGSNQENAAYPSGLCAERTALFYANSQYPNQAIIAIAIAAFHDGNFTQETCVPCGSCRQVLAEIENRFNKSIKIIMYGSEAIYEVSSVKELLPLCFGKNNME